jgi:hypothetical protein
MVLRIKNEMAENVVKISDANKNILPEFQEFLIERKLAPEKNDAVSRLQGKPFLRICPKA